MNGTSLHHVNGVDLNVLQVGSGSPALLFLHYWGGSIQSWNAVVKALCDFNRCVALDFRGWGQSSKVAMNHDLNALADDVVGVIDKLHLEEFVLVGHSMGGKVAQLVAARQPQGLRQLILIAPAPPTALDVPEAQRNAMTVAYQTRDGVMGTVLTSSLSDAQRERVVEDALRGSPAAKRAWPEKGMIDDIRKQVGTIGVPVHVIVGSDDPIEPEASLRRIFAEVMPDTVFTVLPDVGHLSPIEAPSQVVAAIRAALHP